MNLTLGSRVWNRAALEAGGPQPCEGERALAALLAAHGLVMNGGVDHALDVLARAEVAAAAEGFRFFGLAEVAELIDAPRARRLRGARADRAYALHVPSDSVLVERVEARLLASPESFAPFSS